MKKIPTIFERDWDGDRSRVINKINPLCQWVFDGEGVATRKLDGTCCLIRNGEFFKRREIKKGQEIPVDFELEECDQETGKTVGWVPVGDGPEDKYHNEAIQNFTDQPVDGTYELVGPRIQGNPENFGMHILTLHSKMPILFIPRTFEGLEDTFSGKNIEGVVFHHQDGRMAKIKLRDFGIKRKVEG